MKGKYVEVYYRLGTKRCWLQEFLGDNNIDYHVEMVPFWTGTQTPKYHNRQVFYVSDIIKLSKRLATLVQHDLQHEKQKTA